MIALRPARVSDARALLRWRNDATAYRHFLADRPVATEEHERWLKTALRDPKRRLFVIELDRAPAGQVRLDLGRGGRADISITVDRKARGRGVGPAALRAAAARARRLGVLRLEALVAADNPGSAIAFLKAGYRFASVERRAGRPFYRMELAASR